MRVAARDLSVARLARRAPLPVDKELLARGFAGEPVYETVVVQGPGRLRVVYMPVRGGAARRPLVVMVGLPERFVASEVRSFDIMIALALATIILLTAASALLLAERAIRPLERIAAAAEAVNARNLKERLPEPGARDQLGRLVTVFNSMLARLDAAFEAQRRFYRAPAARELRPEGSGICLAMAATIARLHDATIDVSSEKGAGARFVVSFASDS